jgi:hypothetical protein
MPVVERIEWRQSRRLRIALEDHDCASAVLERERSGESGDGSAYDYDTVRSSHARRSPDTRRRTTLPATEERRTY